MLFNYTVGNSLNNEEGHYKFSKKSILTFGIVLSIGAYGMKITKDNLEQFIQKGLAK